MRNVRQQTRKRELVPEHTGSREEWRVMDRRVAGSHNIDAGDVRLSAAELHSL